MSAIALQAPDTRREERAWRYWLPTAGVAAALFAVAWWSERIALVVLVALILVVVWQAASARQFRRWQLHGLSRPPEMSAPWDEIADLQYRRTRNGRLRMRALVHRLRRAARLEEALPDALVVIDGQRRIEWQSARAKAYLGLDRRDVGKSLTSLLRHPDLVAMVDERSTDAQVELTLPLSERQLEIRVTRLDDEHRLLIARDVTQLQRLLTMRQEFVANVSHELRTPLTVIMGYLEQIEDSQFDAAETKEIVHRLTSPATRMKHLVEDLLLLTRLEASNAPTPEELAPVDVARQLHAMVDEMGLLASTPHNITLKVEPNLHVLGIERELYSAFNNLLGNAIRYSPDGGDIVVRWFATTDGARFEVQDHGVGIAPEHLGRITERFYRVDAARSRSSGGTGLGLAIVKHVLRRHGAELGVTSVVGAGSTFYCEFETTRIWRNGAGGAAHPE